MTKTAADRLPAADLAARLRERAEEYAEAGREKLRAESALLAAMSNYERVKYRLDRVRAEWDARLAAVEPTNVAGWRDERAVVHLGPYDAEGAPLGLACEGVGGPLRGPFNAVLADCPACLASLDVAALDEVPS